MSNLVSLARYTTFGIGGTARVTVANGVEDLISLCPSVVLGFGSNVLISDKGVRERVVINRAQSHEFSDCSLYAQSGCSLSLLAQKSSELGFSGLEWAYLLPSTVGGAVVMNAGALGKSIGDCVTSVGVLRNGKVEELSRSDCGFSYRKSCFNTTDVVLYARFTLQRADRTQICERMDITKRMRSLQPKGKSAGCIYKTDGKSAGWYIDRAGLKNKRVGDIYVSPVHAGFFINAGRGTARDVLALMDYVEKTVQDKFGKTLEKEIKLIGEF
ncbi:MAG: UDP-N-acetylmuramate dehydrogenase [Clostridia bacterium]|nr:UDP-N-acetylmuramate dehydrogenase [Clostridia bacterium]